MRLYGCFVAVFALFIGSACVQKPDPACEYHCAVDRDQVSNFKLEVARSHDRALQDVQARVRLSTERPDGMPSQETTQLVRINANGKQVETRLYPSEIGKLMEADKKYRTAVNVLRGLGAIVCLPKVPCNLFDDSRNPVDPYFFPESGPHASSVSVSAPPAPVPSAPEKIAASKDSSGGQLRSNQVVVAAPSDPMNVR